MDAMQAILNRRSIRRYTEEEVSEEVLNRILEAAMYAPSAGNERPWHFVVVRDSDRLGRVPSFHPHAKMVAGARVAILVCGDPTLEVHDGFLPIDCAAATQNLLLAIHAEGLGGVWLGVYPVEERMRALADLCHLPTQIQPFALVPLGHPAHQPKRPHRFLTDRIHWEKW